MLPLFRRERNHSQSPTPGTGPLPVMPKLNTITRRRTNNSTCSKRGATSYSSPSTGFAKTSLGRNGERAGRSGRQGKRLKAIPMSALGQKQTLAALFGHVRFTPESGHGWNPSGPLRANSRHRPCYSITSSARASTDAGISSPIALAVLRLRMNSNLVGCCTGRSPGLAPLRI